MNQTTSHSIALHLIHFAAIVGVLSDEAFGPPGTASGPTEATLAG